MRMLFQDHSATCITPSKGTSSCLLTNFWPLFDVGSVHNSVGSSHTTLRAVVQCVLYNTHSKASMLTPCCSTFQNNDQYIHVSLYKMEVCREKAEHSSTPDLTWRLLCMCLEHIVHAFHIHVHVCAVLLLRCTCAWRGITTKRDKGTQMLMYIHVHKHYVHVIHSDAFWASTVC